MGLDCQILRRVFPCIGLVACGVLLASCKPGRSGDELVKNGGFEKPFAPVGKQRIGNEPPAPSDTGGNAHIILGIAPGREPPGFGWKVESGDVDVTAYGYDPGDGALLLGKMADGYQCLDLDGYRPGTISQSVVTEPGKVYLLTFAYANNPDGNTVPGHAFKAKVSLVDAASGADLVAPWHITHASSTAKDYHWTRPDPVAFTARGTRTMVRFASEDEAGSAWGIFLDDVAIKEKPLLNLKAP